MGVENLSHYGSRAFFIVALALFTMAFLEWVLVYQLRVVPRLFDTNPGRLLEFSAMFLIPVITVLLRQIREELRTGRRA